MGIEKFHLLLNSLLLSSFKYCACVNANAKKTSLNYLLGQCIEAISCGSLVFFFLTIVVTMLISLPLQYLVLFVCIGGI